MKHTKALQQFPGSPAQFDAEVVDLRCALDVIGDKWSALILYYLHQTGPSRFTACQMAGLINTKTLTQRLGRLEKAGLLSRTEFNEYPPRTEYALTASGEKLMPILQTMAQWAGENLEQTSGIHVPVD